VLTPAEAGKVAERTSPAASSFEAVAGADELPVEGGAGFGPPNLLVRFAGDNRAAAAVRPARLL
jgi:alpha-galactosidase